ncbi:MAG: hypothetical protein IJL36_03775, partial [Clostridia bacterium]|nr:hypothetical protein [Clostridia bacterium]
LGTYSLKYVLLNYLDDLFSVVLLPLHNECSLHATVFFFTVSHEGSISAPAGLLLCRIIPALVHNYSNSGRNGGKDAGRCAVFSVLIDFCHGILFSKNPVSHMPFVGKGQLPGNRNSTELKGETV